MNGYDRYVRCKQCVDVTVVVAVPQTQPTNDKNFETRTSTSTSAAGLIDNQISMFNTSIPYTHYRRTCLIRSYDIPLLAIPMQHVYNPQPGKTNKATIIEPSAELITFNLTGLTISGCRRHDYSMLVVQKWNECSTFANFCTSCIRDGKDNFPTA
jgi:hypothetical protein